MIHCLRWLGLLSLVLLLAPCSPAAAAPEGQLTWAVHTTLVPAWFAPYEDLKLKGK